MVGILMKMRGDRKRHKHPLPFSLWKGGRKYHAGLLVPHSGGKGRAQRFHAMSANIHNLCGAWSWEKETVHPSPREMVVSSQTPVWNHRQLLHDMLLYGGTFYILLSGAGKINAKSQLSPSHFAALKHRPLSGRSTASAESPCKHVFVRLFVHVDSNSLAAELLQKMKGLNSQ